MLFFGVSGLAVSSGLTTSADVHVDVVTDSSDVAQSSSACDDANDVDDDDDVKKAACDTAHKAAAAVVAASSAQVDVISTHHRDVALIADDVKDTCDLAPSVVSSVDAAVVVSDVRVEASDEAQKEAACCTLPVNVLDGEDTETVAVNADTEDAVCLLHQLSQQREVVMRATSSKSGAVFWKCSWRQMLCTCPSCMVIISHLSFMCGALMCGNL